MYICMHQRRTGVIPTIWHGGYSIMSRSSNANRIPKDVGWSPIFLSCKPSEGVSCMWRQSVVV